MKIASIFLKSSGILIPPNKPKWSITAPISSCPAMTVINAGATPIFGTTRTMIKTYKAPSKPPTSCHFGTLDTAEIFPFPKKITTKNNARVPITKEINAPSTAPTFFPSPPLMTACKPIAIPPSSAKNENSHFIYDFSPFSYKVRSLTQPPLNAYIQFLYIKTPSSNSSLVEWS